MGHAPVHIITAWLDSNAELTSGTPGLHIHAEDLYGALHA